MRAKPSPEAPKPETPAEPEKKLWTLNADSLKGYLAAFKDLQENAPRVLEGATENALAMVKANDGLTFGNKATAILETHGLRCLVVVGFSRFGTYALSRTLRLGETAPRCSMILPSCSIRRFASKFRIPSFRLIRSARWSRMVRATNWST